MIPGMANIKDLKVDEKEFTRIEAIICSMTDKERKNPKLLNGSRRIRIANGSGTSVQEINKFMKSFEMTQKMMKQMKDKKSLKKMMKEMIFLRQLSVVNTAQNGNQEMNHIIQ